MPTTAICLLMLVGADGVSLRVGVHYLVKPDETAAISTRSGSLRLSFAKELRPSD